MSEAAKPRWRDLAAAGFPVDWQTMRAILSAPTLFPSEKADELSTFAMEMLVRDPDARIEIAELAGLVYDGDRVSFVNYVNRILDLIAPGPVEIELQRRRLRWLALRRILDVMSARWHRAGSNFTHQIDVYDDLYSDVEAASAWPTSPPLAIGLAGIDIRDLDGTMKAFLVKASRVLDEEYRAIAP